jgi:hypothetical protein
MFDEKEKTGMEENANMKMKPINFSVLRINYIVETLRYHHTPKALKQNHWIKSFERSDSHEEVVKSILL